MTGHTVFYIGNETMQRGHIQMAGWGDVAL
jgi:hypothetical protein